jgi:hypothetical protein
MKSRMESESTPLPLSTKLCGFQVTFEEHRRETLLHLVRMAKTQGFKQHTWHRVKELENDIYGYYNGIQEEFLNKIKGLDNESV